MSSSTKPLVSIIIRTKNEERWIHSCLKAVFKQEYKNFEVIIADNNSESGISSFCTTIYNRSFTSIGSIPINNFTFVVCAE